MSIRVTRGAVPVAGFAPSKFDWVGVVVAEVVVAGLAVVEVTLTRVGF